MSLSMTLGGFPFHPQKAYAVTNSTINFQARLEGIGGSITPDGLYNIQFKLYSASSGGVALWTESYYDQNGATAGLDFRTQVTNGFVTVSLGSQTAFPTTIDWNQNLYLTMNVGGTTQTATPSYDGEMNPRLALTAVPYAFKAGQLAQFNSTSGFTSTLSLLQPTVGNQTFQVADQTAAGTYNICVQGATTALGGCAASTGGAGYIQNQNAGAQASANFNISGSGSAATLQATSGINTGAGAGTNRIDAAGNLVNINNITASGTLTVTSLNSIRTNLAANTVINADLAVLAQSPIPKTLWHDLLAFNKYATPTFEQFNGTWNAGTLDTGLFAQQENRAVAAMDGTTTTAARWTWNAGNIAWSQGAWLNIGFTYTAVAANKTILYQSSADGITWTTRHTSTGNTQNAVPAWFFVTDNQGDPYVRLTITTTNAQPVNLSSIRLLSNRWGDQGGGSELSYPYSWDASQRLAIGAGAAVANGNLTVGTNTTTASGGIYLGTDTNLYRSGASLLQTDGSFNTSGGLQTGGTSRITAAGILQNVTTDTSILTSGTLAAIRGGTGQSSYVIGDLLYASSTTALSRLADVGTGSCLISGGVGAAVSWGACGAGSANTALSNLSAVAINTSLLPGVTNSIDLGSSGLTVRTGYFGTSVITPVIDTASAVALNVGTTASVINLNKNVVVAAGQYINLIGSGTRPGSPTDGMLYYDTTLHQLLQYNANASNNKWQADRSNSTKIVGTSASTGGAVASQNPDGADFVNASTTSAQTVINSAIAALPATGGSVYLMEGTYIIDGTINLPSNITFVGAGKGTVIKLKDSTNAAVDLLTAATKYNVKIQNLELDGNTTNQTAGTQNGLALSNMGSGTGTTAVSGFAISGLTAANFRNYGASITTSTNSSLTNSTFRNNSTSGGYAGVFLSGSHITVSGNLFQGNNVTSGYGLQTSGSELAFTGNIFQANSTGLYSQGNSITVTGNTFHGNTNYGVYLPVATNTIVSNNVIEANGTGIYLVSASQIGISGNTITGNSDGINVGGASHLSVTGNNILSNTNRGIYAVSATYLDITSNTVSSNVTGLYLISDNHAVVSSNEINSNTSQAIALGLGTYNSIRGNNLHDNGGTGAVDAIYADNAELNLTISDNTITDTAGTGVAIRLSSNAGAPRNAYISNNTFSGTGAASIVDSGINTIYANQLDANGNLINRGKGAFSVNTTTASTSLTLQGGLSTSQLPTPATPVITKTGAAGAVTWGYKVTAYDGLGETLPSTEGTIATGVSPLTGANFTTITWVQIPGAISYKIYRTTSGGTPATTGLIGTVNGSTIVSFNDTGIAASTAVPVANSTGGGSFVGLLQGTAATFSGTLAVTGTTSLNGVVTLGTASGTTGQLSFANSGNASLVSLQAGASSAAYALTLPTVAPATSQCLQSGAATAGLLVFATCGAGSANAALSNLSAVAINTSLLPGVTNSIDLGSGALTVRTGYFGTSLVAPSLDTTGATTLTIGGANTNAVSIGNGAAPTTVVGGLIGNTSLTLASSYTSASATKVSVSGTMTSAVTTQWNGIQNQINFNPTGASVGNMYGLINIPTVTGSALAIGNLVGAYSRVDTSAGYTGQVTNGYGFQAGPPSIAGTNKFTNYMGVQVDANASNGGNTTGTINNYGLRVLANTTAAGTGGTLNNYAGYLQLASAAGTGTTNNYGLYITGNGGGSSAYSLYNNSTALSLFQGSAQVNTSVLTPLLDTATAVPLNIGTTNATVINLNKNTTVAANSSFTANGSALFKDATNSATAFQIQNSAGTSVLNVVTTANGGAVTIGSSTVERTFSTNFPNGVANQKFDLYFASMSGQMEITLGSEWTNQNANGSVKKTFFLGMDPVGSIYTNQSRYSEATGVTSDNFAISDVTWDATNSRYRVQIVHRVSTGNSVFIDVKAWVGGNSNDYVGAIANMGMTSVYTTDTTAFVRPTVSFTDNVGIGVADAGAFRLNVQGGDVKFGGNTSTTAFQVQNAGGTTVLAVDTFSQMLTVRAATDLATLGGNLAAATFVAWTSTNWTLAGANTTATHVNTAGNTSPLTDTTYTPTIGASYQVDFTLSGTCGVAADTITATFGGQPLGGALAGDNNCSGNYSYVVTASSAAKLNFAPTAAWVGTISGISIKQITNLIGSTVTVKNVSGVDALQVRASNDTSSLFVGVNSGQYANATAFENVAFGNFSLQSITSGYENTGIGAKALQNSTTGNENTAVGAWALQASTTGSYNTAIGSGALQFATTGGYNTAIGRGALLSNTTGSNNTANGFDALLSNTTGNSNNAFGNISLQSNTTGIGNNAFGDTTLFANTTGSFSNAFGSGALAANNGDFNNAFGLDALRYNTTGTVNAAFGGYALRLNQTGSENTAVGDQALSQNVAGNYNTGLGRQTLYNNTSDGNTAVGYASGFANITGSQNTALGFYAGYHDTNTLFSTSIGISRSTVIGVEAQVQASNTIVLGSVDTATQVVVGATIGVGTNLFGVSPIETTTSGTASQGGTTTITGSGANGWTTAMIGDKFIWADGNTGTVASVPSASSLTLVSGSFTETTQAYRIHHVGLQVTNAGVVQAGDGLVVGSATTDANQRNLQLDSFSTFADSGACNTTTNQGALYYNTNTNAIRTCVNAGWEDVMTTGGLGLIMYGIVPDSGGAAGAAPGDYTGITAVGAGPCKVIMGSAANTVRWKGCIAYSGGRKVIVPDQSSNFSTGITTTANAFQNLCLSGAGNQPTFVAAASITEASAGMPAFSATAPVLCLATIKETAGGTALAQIYDTRTFTTTTKQFANIVTTASSTGWMVNQTTTAGQYTPTNAAAGGRIAGVVVTTAGGTTANTINAIIATAGPTFVKAVTTGTVGDYVQTVASAGYTTTVNAANAAIYSNAGVAQSSFNATACTASTDTCRGSVFTILNIR